MLGGGPVARQEGTDHIGTVDAQTQSAAEGRVIQWRTGDIAADILQNGGGGVLIADVSGGADGRGAGEVGGDQLHVMGGKAVEHGVLVGGFDQEDPVHRLSAALPPGLAGHQIGAGFLLREEVWAGAHRGRVLFSAGLDDGNVQQGRQGAVGRGQGDGDAVRSGGDALDPGEPAPVAV